MIDGLGFPLSCYCLNMTFRLFIDEGKIIARCNECGHTSALNKVPAAKLKPPSQTTYIPPKEESLFALPELTKEEEES